MSLGRPGELRQWWWRSALAVRLVPALAVLTVTTMGVVAVLTDSSRPAGTPASGIVGITPVIGHDPQSTPPAVSNHGTACHWHGALTSDPAGRLLTCGLHGQRLKWMVQR